MDEVQHATESPQNCARKRFVDKKKWKRNVELEARYVLFLLIIN